MVQRHKSRPIQPTATLPEPTRGGGLATLGTGSHSVYPFAQRKDETPEEHNLFAKWIDLGPSRTFAALARWVQVPEVDLRELAARMDWEPRCAAFTQYYQASLIQASKDLVAGLDVEIDKLISLATRDQLGKLFAQIADPMDNPTPLERIERIRKLAVVKGAFQGKSDQSKGEGPKILNVQFNVAGDARVEANVIETAQPPPALTCETIDIPLECVTEVDE